MAKRSIFVALFLMMLDMDPLMNALSNPRLVAIRGPDIWQLMAVGLDFGFAFGLLVGARWFGGRKAQP